MREAPLGDLPAASRSRPILHMVSSQKARNRTIVTSFPEPNGDFNDRGAAENMVDRFEILFWGDAQTSTTYLSKIYSPAFVKLFPVF